MTKAEYEVIWNNMVEQLKHQYTPEEIREGFDVWYKESIRFDR